MRLTYAMLEKQIKDLRARISNMTAKAELKELESEERIDKLKDELGELPNQVSMLQECVVQRDKEIKDLKAENKSLKKELSKSNAIIEKLKLLIGKLRAKTKKNSTTSDKPPSMDPIRKPKPQSLRVKSGKKPGGQLGHPGHGLKLFENPTEIIEIKPEECINCPQSSECASRYTARQKVDLKVVIEVTEERVFGDDCPLHGSKVAKLNFSEGYNNPVQYGENLKATVALISEHGCVSVSKTADIINSMSEGALKISCGTVVNIQNELSKKLDETINAIRMGLIAGDVLNADETGVRVNGGLGWMQVFCNDRFALFNPNKKRGDIDDDDNLGLLAYFTGILVHDHFVSYYKYEHLTHAECNEHILRYLKSLIEIFKHSWAQEMSDLLKSACHEKNELLRADKTEMPPEDVDRFSNEYDSILEKGMAEYKAATGGNKKRESYHTDERRLLNRLKENKPEHLLFLNEFRAPFTNNQAERGCRAFKCKQKVAGCFRSAEGAMVFARILSLITTLKKQDRNVFAGIRAVFSGKVPISTA